MEWQPVRIAPLSKWCPEIPKYHWASQFIGKIVRVKALPGGIHECCTCTGNTVQLHPEDRLKVVGERFIDMPLGSTFGAAPCQILAD